MSLGELLAAEQLRTLIGDYLEAADRGRSADLAALFAPDGVLDIRGEGVDAGVYRGPDAILAVPEQGSDPATEVQRPGVRPRNGSATDGGQGNR